MNTLDCDFCGGETTKDELMILPVDRFEIPQINYWNFSWGWGACPECALFIFDNDWEGLHLRAVEHHPSGPKVGPVLAIVYAGLREHRNGPLRPWDPAVDESEDET